VRLGTEFDTGYVTPSGSLPSYMTNFIGRCSIVDNVVHRIAENRLVSLVGPGGCGKTRLAVEVARKTVCGRTEAVCFVDLSGLSNPGPVPDTVRKAVGLPEVPGQAALETLSDRLADEELLLLLDNCEHLIDACATLTEALLRCCQGVRVLATSRECLNLTGEVVVGVDGLELPEPTTAGEDGWLERSESGRLFIERAGNARADFALEGDDSFAAAAICERLDGIPLALELAAARVRVMSVRAIADGLSDRFRFLSSTGRARPARHQTLLASIEWSSKLLGDDERALLFQLSVFASGFTLAAAEAICASSAVEPEAVFELLASLVEKSLVQALPGADRFRLHETICAYTSARLESEGTTAAVRDRHLEHFTKMAKALKPKYGVTHEESVLRALDADLDNVRAALDWALESKQFDAGAELMAAVGHVFYVRGLRAEAYRRCRELLAAEVAPQRRAEVLAWGARFSSNQDPTASLRLARELTALARSLGDDGMLARGLISEATVLSQGEPKQVVVTVDEALPLARRLGLVDIVVFGLVHKMLACKWFCRYSQAVAFAEEAVLVADEAAWEWGAMRARAQLALAAVWAGHLQRALDESSIVLHFCEGLPDPLLLVLASFARGEALYFRGDPAAIETLERTNSIAMRSGDVWNGTCAEAVKGKALIWFGHLADGYAILERGEAKIKALGAVVCHIDPQAELIEAAVRLGDMPSARRHLAEYLERAPANNEASTPRLRAEARWARAEGQSCRTHALACEGLGLAYQTGALLYSIELLELVAFACADLGRPAEAARLLGAAENHRDLIGYVRPVHVREELASALENIQAFLGKDAFDQATSEGRAFTLEDAVAYARRGRINHRRARSGWDSLTPSELQVALLVGHHLTNAEIAKRLFISIPTVKSHLNHTYAKLGLANRGQLAAASHRRDEV
jgi:predicted ATPase/DNA-binding CsgD family transcriptional regulator